METKENGDILRKISQLENQRIKECNMTGFKHNVESDSYIYRNAPYFPDEFAHDFRECKTLSYLLPYDLKEKCHTKLNDGLKEYRMLLLAAEQALTSFLNDSLANFDSLVGENACQIRATLLAVIVKQKSIGTEELLEEINYLIKRIDFESQKLDSSREEHSVLGVFLEQKNLHLKVNQHELFLIASYILTKVRVLLPPNPERRIVRNESTDTRKVKEISTVGSTFARELVKKLRNIVSTISVNFVQDIAELLPLPESIMDMVSDKYCVNHDKFGRLKCLPSFWYTLVLLKYSLEIELPVVLIMSQIASDKNFESVGQISIYYQVINGKYQKIAKDRLSEDTTALVILGSCCRKQAEFQNYDVWQKELINYNLTDLILAYAAAHRQYPDENKDILVVQSNCQLFKFYTSKASEWGCSLSNPSLFFLVHAYCDKIKNVSSAVHTPT